jgi:hypothetical protein
MLSFKQQNELKTDCQPVKFQKEGVARDGSILKMLLFNIC